MSQFTVGEKVMLTQTLTDGSEVLPGTIVTVAEIEDGQITIIKTDGSWGWHSHSYTTGVGKYWAVRGEQKRGTFEKLERNIMPPYFEFNPGQRHPYYNGHWYSESDFDRLSGRIRPLTASEWAADEPELVSKEEQSIIKKTMSYIKNALKSKEQKALEHFDIVNACGELTSSGRDEVTNYIFEHGSFNKEAFTKVFVDLYDERDTK